MTEEDLQALRDRQLTEANFQKLLARVEALEQQVAQMRDLLERSDCKMLPEGFRRCLDNQRDPTPAEAKAANDAFLLGLVLKDAQTIL